MVVYTLLEALVGIVGGLLIAICTKKKKDLKYGILDKIGIATNILLAAGYAVVSPLYLFLGMISEPCVEGFLAVIGWIVCIITASAAMVCALGLGASVALRKIGKSKLSFAVQFAGAVSILLTVLLYMIFVGTLISPLN